MDPRWCIAAVCMCALLVAISDSVPMTPENFNATATGPRSIHFTWNIESIVDSLSCGTPDTTVLMVDVGEGVSSAEYDTFRPNTVYTCYLSVRVDGSGMVGENPTVVVQTPEDTPSAPTRVGVRAVSSSKINVTWGPPEQENGYITHYTVYIRYNTATVTSHNVTGTIHATTINGVPACDVHVSVSANTRVGEGPPSGANTLEEEPGPVSHLQVTALSPSSLAVRWGRPQTPNGYIQQYNYTVRDRNRDVLVGSVDSGGNSESLIIQVDMLDQHVEYTVGVTAITCTGWGPTESETVYTVEAVPAAPQISSHSVIRNFTSIQLNWTTFNGRGRIAGHTINYEALYGTKCHTMTEELPLSTPIPPGLTRNMGTIIHGLDPNVSYSVSITAYNSAGNRGDSSTPQIVSPLVIPARRGYTISSRTSTIQLRLSGVRNCTKWRMLEHSDTVLSAVVARLYLLCQECNNPGIQLSDSTLLCTGDRNQVVFRATLARCPCRKCHTCFEFWLSIPSPILKLENEILLADTTCPLYTDSLDSNSCRLQETTGQASCSIAGVLFGGIFTGLLISLLALLTVICFRKYRATRGGKVDIECRATQDGKVDSEPAPTVRYQPDPKLFVQEESDGYEPLSPFQSTVAMVASNTKNKRVMRKGTAAAALPRHTEKSSPRKDSSTQEPADGEYEIPSLVVTPSGQSSNTAVLQNSSIEASPSKVEYDIPETVETAVTETQVSKQNLAQSASAIAHRKGITSKGLQFLVSQKGFDCQVASAAQKVRQSESDRTAGMKLTPAASASTSVQESPSTSQEQKQLHKKKPLLPNKAMVAQARAPGAPTKVRGPTVRPKPQDKVARNIPTTPNSAYRAITCDTENVYT